MQLLSTRVFPTAMVFFSFAVFFLLDTQWALGTVISLCWVDGLVDGHQLRNNHTTLWPNIKVRVL